MDWKWPHCCWELVFIAAGTIQSRKTGQKKWRIFTSRWDRPGSGQCIFIGLHDSGSYMGSRSRSRLQVQQKTERSLRKTQMQSQNQVAGSDSNIPGSDWRTYRAYSEDLHLDDTGALIFCLSPLDNRNGYAVYDSANGARVGNSFMGIRKRSGLAG